MGHAHRRKRGKPNRSRAQSPGKRGRLRADRTRRERRERREWRKEARKHTRRAR